LSWGLPKVYAQSGASLYLQPQSGSFVVGSTFTVSIYLNTGGDNINTVEADLVFPPDKLQVVSPTIGNSFFKIWFGTPTYSNITGTLNFRGGVPSPGINTSNGLITTITFRAKTTGGATINFTDKSKVLLDDGRGSNILTSKTGANLSLILPPPGGPAVSSPTHPDQNKWYGNSSPYFAWDSNGVRGYSYILNKEPVDVPDDIVDGTDSKTNYKDLEDGTWFFHIKALGSGSWGGSTHYQVLIDKTPPALFPITIEPSDRTASRQPVIIFETTDKTSGIDHYEMKLLNVSRSIVTPEAREELSKALTPFFIEANSPHLTQPLDLGEYDLIIRAYDKAQNFTETTSKLKIVRGLIRPFGSKGMLFGDFLINWSIFWTLLLLLLFITAYFAWVMWQKHHGISVKLGAGIINTEHRVVDELKTLLHIRKDYPKNQS